MSKENVVEPVYKIKSEECDMWCMLVRQKDPLRQGLVNIGDLAR